MSFHDGASDVSRVNRETCKRPVVVDPWTYQVLEAALSMHHQSKGAFDIAVAPPKPHCAGVARASQPCVGQRDVFCNTVLVVTAFGLF